MQDKVDFWVAYNTFSLDPSRNYMLLPIDREMRILTDLVSAFRGRQIFWDLYDLYIFRKSRCGFDLNTRPETELIEQLAKAKNLTQLQNEA